MAVSPAGSPDGDPAATGPALRAAYSATAGAWSAGPERVYRPLADVLVAAAPVPLAGRLVLDLGAGTGVAGRAVRARGGRVVALDAAHGMVAAGEVPGAVADARHLPVRDGSVGAVVAAFCLNHVDPPATALREARRVTTTGGCVLASSYGSETGHPARPAVEAALTAAGWSPPPWYLAMKHGPAAELETVDGMARAARAGGLEPDVDEVEVPIPGLDAADLVAWRLGTAQAAPFLAGLPPDARAAVTAHALGLLGDPPPLVRRMVRLRAVV
jgi:SAM-dependent methyltransferase